MLLLNRGSLRPAASWHPPDAMRPPTPPFAAVVNRPPPVGVKSPLAPTANAPMLHPLLMQLLAKRAAGGIQPRPRI